MDGTTDDNTDYRDDDDDDSVNYDNNGLIAINSFVTGFSIIKKLVSI